MNKQTDKQKSLKIFEGDSKRIATRIPFHESELPKKLPQGELLAIDQIC